MEGEREKSGREEEEEDSIVLPPSTSLSVHLHESRHLSSPNLVPSSSMSAGDTVGKETEIPALTELTF